MKSRIGALGILVAGVCLALFVFGPWGTSHPFKLGLDLAGGTLLTYRVDTTTIAPEEIDGAIESLRDVIGRRANSQDLSGAFGVLEPVVQTEEVSLGGTEEHRVIVELPGITDVDEAVRYFGETPLLEFKLLGNGDELLANGTGTPEYIDTGLTGRYLTKSQLQFGAASAGSLIQEPIVALTFSDEGGELFAKITREHTGEVLAIFLDGTPISAPVIQTEISDGRAVITGMGSADEAKNLVRNLNFGALPAPIELVGVESIGASLGSDIARAGVTAGIWGFLIIAVFMILWYRLPGIIAALTLAFYALVVLSLFKLIPVTLTSAGIAGFILSVGMAVDANILIFERMKEELRAGKNVHDAINEGFARAWLSIRDGNLTSILAAVILFYTTTSLVKGFALTLILGVVVSMFTALSVSRALLNAVAPKDLTGATRFLFSSGFSKE